jgi:hypothetical protein
MKTVPIKTFLFEIPKIFFILFLRELKVKLFCVKKICQSRVELDVHVFIFAYGLHVVVFTIDYCHVFVFITNTYFIGE